MMILKCQHPVKNISVPLVVSTVEQPLIHPLSLLQAHNNFNYFLSTNNLINPTFKDTSLYGLSTNAGF
jgi:hypothetical protein